MDIIGPDGGKAMHLERPFKCSSFGCGCCLFAEMSIQDGMGNPVGSVINRFDCCGDLFDILDESGIPILTIHGECCQVGKFCPCSELNWQWYFMVSIVFDILNPKTGSTGSIKKVWSGVAREMVSCIYNM